MNLDAERDRTLAFLDAAIAKVSGPLGQLIDESEGRALEGVASLTASGMVFDPAEWDAISQAIVRPAMAGVIAETVRNVDEFLDLAPELRAQILGEIDLLGHLPAFERQVSTLGKVAADKVFAEVNAGLLQGEGMDKLAERITSSFDVVRSNADRIVRTEVHKAVEATNWATTAKTANALGMSLWKTWLATFDDRTRDAHVAAHGQTVPMDADFGVGWAVGPYPGELGSAVEDINCRCTTTYQEAPTGESPPLHTREAELANIKLRDDKVAEKEKNKTGN